MSLSRSESELSYYACVCCNYVSDCYPTSSNGNGVGRAGNYCHTLVPVECSDYWYGDVDPGL